MSEESFDQYERGRRKARGVLLRVAWLATMLALLPVLLGTGPIQLGGLLRLAFIVLICIQLYQGRSLWLRWLLLILSILYLLVAAGAVLAVGADALGLLFVVALGLYAYHVSRLFWDKDIAAFFRQQKASIAVSP